MEIKSVQIYPARERVELNDKITKCVFNLSEGTYEQLTTGGKALGVVEIKNHPKLGTVKSYVRVLNSNGDVSNEPLNQFDRAVFNVLLSEKLAGNERTTLGVIFRGLTGKIGRDKVKMHTNQRSAILRSVTRLMSTVIEIDMTDTCEKLKYNDGRALTMRGVIFPCKFISANLGGKLIETVFFLDNSPLYDAATAKNQFLRYDASLLDVPNQFNTPTLIAVKNYIISRLVEIARHRLIPTLTFADIFDKCGLATSSPKSKCALRQDILAFLQYLRQRQFLAAFDLVKTGKILNRVTFQIAG